LLAASVLMAGNRVQAVAVSPTTPRVPRHAAITAVAEEGSVSGYLLIPRKRVSSFTTALYGGAYKY
jgi:hypothetical protein